jgi:hypothetical protein
MCRLFQPNDIVFLTLVLEDIRLAVAIAEAEAGAVGEVKRPVALGVFADVFELGEEVEGVIFAEFGEGATEEEEI